MTYLEFLDQRESIRHFDPNMTISDTTIQSILQHAANAPSNNNAQPWRVVVVKNHTKQQLLQKMAANQAQVGTAAAVFLLFGDPTAYNTQTLIQFSLAHQLLLPNQVAAKKQRIEQYFTLHPEDKQTPGLRLDVGLFAMNLMHVLRTYGYDATPMRGVDFRQIKTYLTISETWQGILMLPVGKALVPGHDHVRRNVAEFVKIIH
ncbi:NADH dehydrogenase [Agrilactobacillus composti DSM 18527 = JCM 14202]|uniref:NADH dehydrogenase n=1 Tax=Agrilactobacillus composti DSM 18527 = JCM 14202 TaxID=1423734 RepID=A0A0R1XTT8_9LACO|nr:NADH dehydrogenase [Agrilactobacillus composti DSM 18527 = JCM 14202]